MKKLLFTPGPLNCSIKIKKKMLLYVGSRDYIFSDTIKNVRKNILKVGNASEKKYSSILIPGSGTYAIESTLSSLIT